MIAKQVPSPSGGVASETIDVRPDPMSRGVLDVLPADQFDALIRVGRARGGLTQDDVMTVLRSVELSSLARSCALSGGFDERLRYGEDVDLVWRIAGLGWRIRYAPEVLVHHQEPVHWR